MPAHCHFPKISSLVKEMLGLLTSIMCFFVCVCAGSSALVWNRFLHQWNSLVPVTTYIRSPRLFEKIPAYVTNNQLRKSLMLRSQHNCSSGEKTPPCLIKKEKKRKKKQVHKSLALLFTLKDLQYLVAQKQIFVNKLSYTHIKSFALQAC